MRLYIYIFISFILSNCYSFSKKDIYEGMQFSYNNDYENSEYIQDQIRYYSYKKCNDSRRYVLYKKAYQENYYNTLSYGMSEALKGYANTIKGNTPSEYEKFIMDEYKYNNPRMITKYDTIAVCYPDSIKFNYKYEDIVKLKFSDTSRLMPSEQNALKRHFSNCNSYIPLSDKIDGCFQSMILIGKNYKDYWNTNDWYKIPYPERGILYDSANRLCLLKPDECYEIKYIFQMQQQENKIKKSTNDYYEQ